jgi:hypothetical protein
LVCIGLFQSGTGWAQEEACSALVRQAFQLVVSTCQAIGRNQVCHGYSQVDAQWRDAENAPSFEVGAIADISNIWSLQTSPIDEALQLWGIALLSLQANLPTTLPGENVTLLVLGDTQLQDQGRIYNTNPYQAFRIRSGITGVSCETVAESGIIIQTPTGAQSVSMQANGVQISFTSTLFVQADPDSGMTINALDGTAEVIVDGVTQILEFGQRLTIPMTQDLLPAGPASAPQPIDRDMVNVPVQLLPRAVDSSAIARASGAPLAIPAWLVNADAPPVTPTPLPVTAQPTAAPTAPAATTTITDDIGAAVVGFLQWLNQGAWSVLPALAAVVLVLVGVVMVVRLIIRRRGG